VEASAKSVELASHILQQRKAEHTSQVATLQERLAQKAEVGSPSLPPEFQHRKLGGPEGAGGGVGLLCHHCNCGMIQGLKPPMFMVQTPLISLSTSMAWHQHDSRMVRSINRLLTRRMEAEIDSMSKLNPPFAQSDLRFLAIAVRHRVAGLCWCGRMRLIMAQKASTEAPGRSVSMHKDFSVVTL
jgi:hypothetical protein